MPAITRKIQRRQLQPLYTEMMRFLYGKREYSSHIELRMIDGVETPCAISFSYTYDIIRWISLECGLRENSKGGELYDFYRFMKPFTHKDELINSWKNGLDTRKFSLKVLRGLFIFFRAHKLEMKVKNFHELEDELLGLFQDKKIAKDSRTIYDEALMLSNRHRNLWNADGFPAEWFDTTWEIFERTDIGICVSYLSFKKRAGLTVVEMNTIYRDDAGASEFHYTGLAGLDESRECIVLQMFRSDKPYTYASMIFRVDDNNYLRQKISIGHYTYYAIRFRKFITKQFIAQKMMNALDELPAAKEFERGTKDYENIDINIRQYLLSRLHNRLSMPDTLIIQLANDDTSLRSWLKSRLKASSFDARIPQCYGDYLLKYYNQQGDMRDYKLTIEAEEPSVDKDFHSAIGKLFINELVYKAEISIVTGNILQGHFIPVDNEDHNLPLSDNNARISLMVKLPISQSALSFRDNLEKMDLFGLIAGVSDEIANQPMCFRCILLPYRNKSLKEMSKSAMARLKDPGAHLAG